MEKVAGRRYDTAQFRRECLANDIPVWVQESPIQPSDEGVLIAVLPGVGSCRDPKGQEGIAHFFEHLPFRGTERFPSSSAIFGAVDGNGGRHNAITSLEWTRFWVSLDKSRFEMAARVVADLVARPLIREEDIKLERGVILDEHLRHLPFVGAGKMMQDIARRVVGEHPYNHPVIGYRRSIQSITRLQLVDFALRYYHAGNIQLVVGGAFAERPDLLDILGLEFGMMFRGRDKVSTIPAPVCESQRFRLTDPRYMRSALAIGWMIPPPDRQKGYALDLLLNALGGSSDSPLAVYLREEIGKTYETDFVRLVQSSLLWTAGFAFPIPAKYFDRNRSLVFKFLENPHPWILRAYRASLARRSMAWMSPIQACFSASTEIVTEGRPISFREDEATEDAFEPEDIAGWQEYFLSQPAVDCEIRPVPEPLTRPLSFTGLT